MFGREIWWCGVKKIELSVGWLRVGWSKCKDVIGVKSVYVR